MYIEYTVTFQPKKYTILQKSSLITHYDTCWNPSINVKIKTITESVAQVNSFTESKLSALIYTIRESVTNPQTGTKGSSYPRNSTVSSISGHNC